VTYVLIVESMDKNERRVFDRELPMPPRAKASQTVQEVAGWFRMAKK
jgi:hypothetical protein